MLGRIVALLAFALFFESCTHKNFLIGANQTLEDPQENRQIASNNNHPPVVVGSPMTTSPCTNLRQSMKEEKLRFGFMRCNVVLNGQVNPEAKFIISEADVCFAISNYTDQNNRDRVRSEMTGTIIKAIDKEKQEFKNIKIGSSRQSDDPFRKPSDLLFSADKKNIKIEDDILFSSSKQTIQFDLEKQMLEYQINSKKNILLGLTTEPIDSAYVNLKCFKEEIYGNSQSANIQPRSDEAPQTLVQSQ
jgi:hypothetical protein